MRGMSSSVSYYLAYFISSRFISSPTRLHLQIAELVAQANAGPAPTAKLQHASASAPTAGVGNSKQEIYQTSVLAARRAGAGAQDEAHDTAAVAVASVDASPLFGHGSVSIEGERKEAKLIGTEEMFATTNFDAQRQQSGGHSGEQSKQSEQQALGALTLTAIAAEEEEARIAEMGSMASRSEGGDAVPEHLKGWGARVPKGLNNSTVT
jgi:hypothetical protein